MPVSSKKMAVSLKALNGMTFGQSKLQVTMHAASLPPDGSVTSPGAKAHGHLMPQTPPKTTAATALKILEPVQEDAEEWAKSLMRRLLAET